MFARWKKESVDQFYNYVQQPLNIAEDLKFKVLLDKYPTMIDRYNMARSITFEDMKRFAEEFFSKLYTKVLVQGNVTKEVAVDVVNNFISTLNCQALDPDTYPQFHVSQLPKGENICLVESFKPNDSYSVVENYYQCEPYSLKKSVILDTIMLILEYPLTKTLEIEEQLGESVYFMSKDVHGILGFTIIVDTESNKHTTQYINNRVDEFLKYASDMLVNMSEQTFEEEKRRLIETKKYDDVKLEDEVDRNWYNEIVDEYYMFDRSKREIEVIKQLTIAEVNEWWKQHIFSDGEQNFRKLSVQVVARKNKDDLPKDKDLSFKFLECEDEKQEKESRYFVKNITDFKNKLQVYPVVIKNLLK